ncbi:MAG: 3-hydroxybutyrate dehydrogenase [Pseudomonadota bacterium]|nr:3-hydroxybutyrate dehydrogenase [Pseudomonadota bacterium]
MTLNGRGAIVTGSTSGIGLAIARALAGEGAKVMLNGLGAADDIERTRADLAADTGATSAYHDADMRDPAAIAAMVEAAKAAFGSVDILVNNAGIQHVAKVEDFPADRWDAVIAINLSSAFHAAAAVLPALKAAGWGRIINIASAHGLVASAEKSAYVAAKHGLVGLTKVIALETAGSGVTCNAICPGWVLTALVEKQITQRAAAAGRPFEQEAETLLLEKQPSGAFTTVEQLGATAVFLTSAAADNMTGASLSVDGGWTAR